MVENIDIETDGKQEEEAILAKADKITEIKKEGETYGMIYKMYFERWQKKQDWKLPIVGWALTLDEAQLTKAAFEWYHGVAATIECGVPMIVSHPEGLVTFEVSGYKISSPGYGC